MKDLEKSIVFFDIESTGTDPMTDRIIELAMIKLERGKEVEKRLFTMNPQIPISPSATEVHGFKDSDVEDYPSFEYFAAKILEFVGDSDLGGYNSNKFDIPMLFCEFNRVGINWDVSQKNKIDVGVMYMRQNPRTLSAAYKNYFGEDLEGAHGAMTDTIATVDVFKEMLRNSELDEMEVSQLSLYSNYDKRSADVGGKFAYDEDDQLIFNFGKYRGEVVTKGNYDHEGFLRWIIKNNFLPDAKDIARQYI
jgi:DNA polymerase-3 subunit epsilon